MFFFENSSLFFFREDFFSLFLDTSLTSSLHQDQPLEVASRRCKLSFWCFDFLHVMFVHRICSWFLKMSRAKNTTSVQDLCTCLKAEVACLDPKEYLDVEIDQVCKHYRKFLGLMFQKTIRPSKDCLKEASCLESQPSHFEWRSEEVVFCNCRMCATHQNKSKMVNFK